MFASKEEITNENKKDILLNLFEDYRAHIMYIEGSAAKTTLAVCSGLLAFPLLLADKLKNISILSAFGITLIIFGITFALLWILHYQRLHYKWLCRAIVRVKQALGLFEEKLFFDLDKFTHERYIFWDDFEGIAPIDSQEWGVSDWLNTFGSLMAATAICCIGSCLMLWGYVL